jgi:hypothetical protein
MQEGNNGYILQNHRTSRMRKKSLKYGEKHFDQKGSKSSKWLVRDLQNFGGGEGERGGV